MSPARAALAAARTYALTGARVLAQHTSGSLGEADRDGFVAADLLVEAGRIAALTPAGAAPAFEGARFALDGRVVLPPFVDVHTHLDKAHIWRRAPNLTGDFAGAMQAVAADREANWSAADVAARLEFALRTAYSHGTRAIRTHIDSIGKQTKISWPAFADARERWRGRLELQATPLFLAEFALEPAFLAGIEAAVDAYGSNVLGAATFMAPSLGASLAALFDLAERKGWDLDFHVDESADPAARSLALIAETATRRRFPGRILAGHCCSLARQADDERERTIEAVARAGIAVVSLPMCNLFLQDRCAGRTPRWRGVTALHELRAAGVSTMIASDNVRDPFYAYGDLDMLEVWREGVRILHLDYPFADWAETVSAQPARVMRLAPPRIAVGGPADLILTRARDFTELFARAHADRVVLGAGLPLDEPPDYAELIVPEGKPS